VGFQLEIAAATRSRGGSGIGQCGLQSGPEAAGCSLVRSVARRFC